VKKEKKEKNNSLFAQQRGVGGESTLVADIAASPFYSPPKNKITPLFA
jgi:hypothetical protein